MTIKIIPKCQRARNRVREHGEIMTLIREGIFKGRPAILVEAIEVCEYRWGGWFTRDEVDFERISS